MAEKILDHSVSTTIGWRSGVINANRLWLEVISLKKWDNPSLEFGSRACKYKTNKAKENCSLFLIAPFWSISLLPMFFCSLISNPVRFTLVPDVNRFGLFGYFSNFFFKKQPNFKVLPFSQIKRIFILVSIKSQLES